MTVIAWDGRTLAADKLAENGGLRLTTKKIFKLSNGNLAGGSGSSDQIGLMLNWLENGEKFDDFPESQKEESTWATILVITKDKKIFKYERTPCPIEFQDRFIAIGSGRDFAMAMMSIGMTSVEGVEVASKLDISCGNGIDTLTL